MLGMLKKVALKDHQQMISQLELTKNLNAIIGQEFPGTVLAIADSKDMMISSSGNLKPDSQYFIASATKLYTTTLILQLADSNQLALNDKIERFLDPAQVERLHFYRGVEYSKQITVEHLLSHTSGLPDYFQATGKSRPSLMDTILLGKDRKWDLNQVLSDAKLLGAEFPPSFKNRALYSDTNFQILGEIVERISGRRLPDIIERQICQKIGLKRTYLYTDPKDDRPVPLNYKYNVLNIPLAMTSFGPDGGIVSDAADGIQFLRCFFDGQLFDRAHLAYITGRWRNIFFPLKYGVGISLFRLPWYFSPFKKFPDLIGHSGLSGAFLYFCPERKVFLSGTVNQIAKPQTSFRLMLRSI